MGTVNFLISALVEFFLMCYLAFSQQLKNNQAMLSFFPRTLIRKFTLFFNEEEYTKSAYSAIGEWEFGGCTAQSSLPMRRVGTRGGV